MNNRFKNKEKVIVYGFGENDGKFYKNMRGFVIERDPYYKNYHIRFMDGTEDWFCEKSLKKYYRRKK